MDILDCDKLYDALIKANREDYEELEKAKYKYNMSSTMKYLVDIINISGKIIHELILDKEQFEKKYGGLLFAFDFPTKAEQAMVEIQSIKDSLTLHKNETKRMKGGSDEADN